MQFFELRSWTWCAGHGRQSALTSIYVKKTSCIELHTRHIGDRQQSAKSGPFITKDVWLLEDAWAPFSSDLRTGPLLGAEFGIQWAGIPPYPVDRSGLSNRIGIIESDEGWAGDYTKAAYRAWFLEHKDFGEPEIATVALQNIGKDANSVIARADSDDIHQKFAEQTDEARSLGIFGVPTFVVGSEIFWGDDRLEEALEWAQQSAAQHAG